MISRKHCDLKHFPCNFLFILNFCLLDKPLHRSESFLSGRDLMYDPVCLPCKFYHVSFTKTEVRATYNRYFDQVILYRPSGLKDTVLDSEKGESSSNTQLGLVLANAHCFSRSIIWAYIC